MKKEFEKLPKGNLVQDLEITKGNKQFIEKFLDYMKGHIVEDRWRRS